MRSQLQAGGVLAVTSRNWELVRASGSGSSYRASSRLVGHGIPAVVVHSWTIPNQWNLPHYLDIGVALLHDDAVTPHVGRLTFWPFTHDSLRADLKACRLTPQISTYTPTVERYLVTATAA